MMDASSASAINMSVGSDPLLRFLVCGAGSVSREYSLRHLVKANGATVAAIVDPNFDARIALARDVARLQRGATVSGEKYRETVKPNGAAGPAQESEVLRLLGDGGTTGSEKPDDLNPIPHFASLDEIPVALADSYDAVYIGTPPTTHLQIVEKSLLLKKHVLLEKPLAANSNQADGIVALVRDAALCVGMNIGMRYNRAVHLLRHELTNMQEFDIASAKLTMHFSQWPREWQKQPWVASRSQGGPMREVGTHWIAAIQELFGERCVRSVRGAVEWPGKGWTDNQTNPRLAENTYSVYLSRIFRGCHHVL